MWRKVSFLELFWKSIQAPKVMDSILEADDTAQLSEQEMSEAHANYHREKNFDGGGRRGGGRGNNNGLSHSSGGPSGQTFQRPLPGWLTGPIPSSHRPHFPTTPAHPQPQPPGIPLAERVLMESVILDAAVRAQIHQELKLKRDFNLGMWEILKRYAHEQRMVCVRHHLLDSHGRPNTVYAMNVPGTSVSFAFKQDGSVWRMVIPTGAGAVPPQPPPLPASRPPSATPSPLIPPTPPATISPDNAGNGSESSPMLTNAVDSQDLWRRFFILFIVAVPSLLGGGGGEEFFFLLSFRCFCERFLDYGNVLCMHRSWCCCLFLLGTKEGRRDEGRFGVEQWRAIRAVVPTSQYFMTHAARHCFTPNAVSSRLTSFVWF